MEQITHQISNILKEQAGGKSRTYPPIQRTFFLPIFLPFSPKQNQIVTILAYHKPLVLFSWMISFVLASATFQGWMFMALFWAEKCIFWHIWNIFKENFNGVVLKIFSLAKTQRIYFNLEVAIINWDLEQLEHLKRITKESATKWPIKGSPKQR